MSTVKCDTIVNASSATNNLSLDASGNVTVGAGLTLTGGALTVGGSVGSAGQILRSNGTTSSWVNGWTLINTITGTSAAALQDTTSLTSTYANYRILIRNLASATNSVTLSLQIYTGGSYQTTGYLSNSSLGAGVGVSLTTGISLTNTSGNSSSYNLTGELLVTNPSSSTLYKMFTGSTTYYDTTGTASVKGLFIGGAYTTNTNAITGFQILASSGNITGTVQVYGAN